MAPRLPSGPHPPLRLQPPCPGRPSGPVTGSRRLSPDTGSTAEGKRGPAWRTLLRRRRPPRLPPAGRAGRAPFVAVDEKGASKGRRGRLWVGRAGSGRRRPVTGAGGAGAPSPTSSASVARRHAPRGCRRRSPLLAPRSPLPAPARPGLVLGFHPGLTYSPELGPTLLGGPSSPLVRRGRSGSDTEEDRAPAGSGPSDRGSGLFSRKEKERSVYRSGDRWGSRSVYVRSFFVSPHSQAESETQLVVSQRYLGDVRPPPLLGSVFKVVLRLTNPSLGPRQ